MRSVDRAHRMERGLRGVGAGGRAPPVKVTADGTAAMPHHRLSGIYFTVVLDYEAIWRKFSAMLGKPLADSLSNQLLSGVFHFIWSTPKGKLDVRSSV